MANLMLKLYSIIFNKLINNRVAVKYDIITQREKRKCMIKWKGKRESLLF